MITPTEARKLTKAAQNDRLLKAKEWASSQMDNIEKCIIQAAKNKEFTTKCYFCYKSMYSIDTDDAIEAFKEIFKQYDYKVDFIARKSGYTKLIIQISWEE